MIVGLRVVLAVGVSVAILGGLALFMAARPAQLRSLHHVSADWATGQFDVELTLTFAAGPDPFALEATDAPSLVVEFRGVELLRRTDRVAGGEPIQIVNVAGITAGTNRFHVRATPETSDTLLSHALRVRILRDTQPVADETLWGEAGQVVEGELVIQVPQSMVPVGKNSDEITRDVVHAQNSSAPNG